MTARARLAWLTWPLLLGFWGLDAPARDERADRFDDKVAPVLIDHCYSCHGDGIKKGDVTLDVFNDDNPINGGHDLWWRVLKNVRSGLMPPAGKPRLSAEEVAALETWVKQDAFGLDPNDPDPGRVTLRRLNRVEYRNTIRDLMGVDFRADEEFPPDDTGYGFDTIADVLTVSPLLLEKYLLAAEQIVRDAVPTVSRVVATRTFAGYEFKGKGDLNGGRLSFYQPAKLTRAVSAPQKGKRRLTLELQVRGEFDFDPGRCRVVFKDGGEELLKKELGWQDGKTFSFEFLRDWEAGSHELTFEVEPLLTEDKKKNSLDLRIVSLKVEGPMEPEHWGRPKNFERFFTRDDPGTGEERAKYAREILKTFATKAYRRPVDERTLDRLVGLAQEGFDGPGKNVETGVARAMVAVLASPRFLFRVEGVVDPNAKYPLLDEYALASRLSYFLWSTMPDDELFRLASKGELRQNLKAQMDRMVKDSRSKMFVENFAGQWLQARDVEAVAIDARTVLARDDGEEKELQREQEEFRAFLAQRDAESKKQAADPKAKPAPFGSIRRSGRFRRLFSPPRADLSGELRTAMKRETEMFFAAIAKEDRSLLDLLDSDYTFLNERLAKHYGVPGVKGDYMRKVTLPKDSVRGGLLTQGTVLVVTSNPTRTSPVKRGLFILDNLLGTPPPPPPAAVPQLEDAEKEFSGREPTLREVMEIHRAKPLCNACHSRMDPLGLALENFNAMGMFREKERGQPLDVGGQLVTGEKFQGVQALKQILKEDHRADFYRCMAEKVLTYAIGRGPEYYDVEAIDRIVARLEQEGGKYSALLMGVVESAPFQKRRGGPVVAGPSRSEPAAGPGKQPRTSKAGS